MVAILSLAWSPAKVRAQVACPGVTIGTATAELVRASQGTGFFLTAMERLHEVMAFALTRRVSIGVNGQANQASSSPRVATDGSVVVFDSSARNFLSTITAARNHVWARGFCGPTRMLDQSPGGVEGDGSSFDPTVSADGTAIAFRSFSNNLLEGIDPSGTRVFVEDMDGIGLPGFTPPATSFSGSEPVLSADGRFVAVSSSTKVDADDDTNGPDIYLRDRTMGTTTLVSRDSDGNHVSTSADNIFDPAISADGRHVAFVSDVSLADPVDFNGNRQIYLRDTLLNTTTLVSIGIDGQPANKECRAVEIAGNGCCVAFRSAATNLVAGVDQTLPSIFLRDLDAGTTERVNVGFSSSPSLWFARLPAIS
ncbi:MAG: PD40 domain-containing protein, partial [Myxococcales bacterium]|nr:PD40 domain-containing protein [Myxococcales bacterium]